LVNPGEGVSVINSGLYISFSHFYLDCEKQRGAFRVEAEVVAAVKLPELLHLVVYAVDASLDVGA